MVVLSARPMGSSARISVVLVLDIRNHDITSRLFYMAAVERALLKKSPTTKFEPIIFSIDTP